MCCTPITPETEIKTLSGLFRMISFSFRKKCQKVIRLLFCASYRQNLKFGDFMMLNFLS